MPAPRPPALNEAQLGAATLSLLARPRLWEALAGALPAAPDATAAPWAAYWATRLDPGLPAKAARAVFEQAHARLAAAGERTGVLLALAALIETYYVDEASLQPMDAWVQALQAVLPADGDWPSPELEAQVMACGLAITLRDQAHPLLARWAARGADLLRTLRPGAARMKLATFLLQYRLWRGESGAAALIVEALPGLDPGALLPAEALVWHESVATFARFAGQPARGRAEVRAALALAEAQGLQPHAYALHAHGAAIELSVPDLEAARAHVEAMRPILARQPQEDQTHYWHFQAGLALLQGDAAQAVALARTTLANSLEIGGAYRTAAHRLSLGQALLVQGEAALALPEFEAACRTAREIQAGLLDFSATLCASAAQQRLGRVEAADALLAQALADGARQDYRATSGWWLPSLVAERAARALRLGLEPAYVRRWVQARGLACPDPRLPAWPWPLALRAFGELQVLRDGAPLPTSGAKLAQRPLDLLRALLAQAPAPLPVATALQWLWPEGAGADQRKAFDVALLRLRRLLGDERLLRLEGARLSLAPEWTWSDVQALASLLQDIAAGTEAPPAAQQAWARELLALAAGPLLAGVEADWARAARERHRRRVVLAVETLATRLAPHDGAAATRLLEQALDSDPTAEALARRLMRWHVARGAPAEARRVLSLSSAMLRLGSGLAPSAETRALAAELGLDP